LKRENTPIESQERSFAIPNPLPPPDEEIAKLIINSIQFVPLVSDNIFPRGTWPWTLSRELSLRLLEKGADDETETRNTRLETEELERATARSDIGPVGALLFARGLQSAHPTIAVSEHATNAAQRSLIDLTDEAFLKDVHFISEGNHAVAILCREAVEKLGQLPEAEQRQLTSTLPPKLQSVLNGLAARRKASHNEPVSESINNVLLESWRNGLREIVQSELRALSDNRQHQATGTHETAELNNPVRPQ
jgi:hypothetical protein